MKILFVLDSLWVGGTERSIAELLPALTKRGVSTILVCLRKRAEGVQEEVLRSGFKIHFLEAGPVGSIRALRRILQVERPDLIHSSLLKSNLITRLAAAGLKIPVLSSIVNTPYEPIRFRDPSISPMRLRMVQFADSLTARFLTTHFHAVSRTAKDSAVRTLEIPADRITVIERGRDEVRMGAPSEARKQEARRRLGLFDEQFVLVNVGRHEYQKGQVFLLEALLPLVQEFPSLVLLIAGRTGSFTEELQRRLSSHSLSNAVRMLGHCENIPEILSASDLFVFPSLFEGLPGSVIEAMALGLPVVASDLDAVREVVEQGQNAILVKSGDSIALTAAIKRMILNEQERKKFGARSREIFLERFKLDKNISRMLNLYENISQKKIAMREL